MRVDECEWTNVEAIGILTLIYGFAQNINNKSSTKNSNVYLN